MTWQSKVEMHPLYCSQCMFVQDSTVSNLVLARGAFVTERADLLLSSPEKRAGSLQRANEKEEGGAAAATEG